MRVCYKLVMGAETAEDTAANDEEENVEFGGT